MKNLMKPIVLIFAVAITAGAMAQESGASKIKHRIGARDVATKELVDPHKKRSPRIKAHTRGLKESVIRSRKVVALR